MNWTIPQSALPSPQQALLLKAALRRDRTAVKSWESWISQIDLDDVDPASQRLLPLVYRNLRRHGAEHPDLGRMKGIHRNFWCKNQLIFRHMATVVETFGAAGIPVMALKGVPLALDYYDDPGLRPMSDFDFLVPADSALQAVLHMQDEGFFAMEGRAPLHKDSFLRTDEEHGRPFMDKEHRECDLHWHLLHDCCWDGADDEYWEHAYPREVHGTEILMPSATDLLLHVCVHGSAYNLMPPMRWVADATTLIEKASDRIDWDRLIDHARRRLLVLPMQKAFAYLESLIGVEIPEAARSELNRTPVSWAERREYRMRLVNQNYKFTVTGRWCQLSRLYHHESVAKRVIAIPEFMQRIWRVKEKRELPRVLAVEVLPAYARKLFTGKDETESAVSAQP